MLHEFASASNQPPAADEQERTSAARLRQWQGTRVRQYHVPSTRTVRVPQPRGTHHVDLDEARASDLHMYTCALRDAREETTGQRGREGATDGKGVGLSTRARESLVHARGVCDAANHMAKQRRAGAAFVRWHGTRYGRTSLAPPRYPLSTPGTRYGRTTLVPPE